MENEVWTLLSGEVPACTPVSAWRHFYRSEWDPGELARATLSFQHRYGWSFVKFNTRATFFGEPWGLQAIPGVNDDTKGPPPMLPYRQVADLAYLQHPPGLPAPYAEQLEALREVRTGTEGIPLVVTLFNPISVLGDLVQPEDLLLEAMHVAAALVFQALDHITHVLLQYARESLRLGADGVFYATTEWASAARLPWELYQRFALPYDRMILEDLREAPFNIFHACGSQSFLPHFWDLPVSAFSWNAADPTNPTLEEAARSTHRVLIGGLDRTLLETSSPQEVHRAAQEILQQAGNSPFILAPGCTVHPAVAQANLDALAFAPNAWKSSSRE
jgi:uroporphyrinogen decarboxylase